MEQAVAYETATASQAPPYLTTEYAALLERVEERTTTLLDAATVQALVRDLWECKTGAHALGERIIAAIKAGRNAEAIKEATRLAGVD